MNKQLCMHCYISGKVQGVWFRASTKEEAERLSIQGWARNLADGRVEVWACGEEDKLELLYHWLQEGPRHAQVQNCTREDQPWKEMLGFKIR